LFPVDKDEQDGEVVKQEEIYEYLFLRAIEKRDRERKARG
jgi:hypothetical protein